MKDLTQADTWKRNFGLLPIHLKPNELQEEYILLDGIFGNFCLKTSAGAIDERECYSKAWSSNTKNYLSIEENDVVIYNWLTKNPERIKKNIVEQNFDKFYNYIIKIGYNSTNDVVPFIIDIFKRFRNITGESTNPVEALNLLFVLLGSVEDSNSSFDFKKWNIDEVNIPSNFEQYPEILRGGVSDINPKIDLIIRHAAGVLFQEAQKEVLCFDLQRDLFGGMSNKLITTSKKYSSIHYTPPYLARTIVENAIRQLDLVNMPQIKIFDPACGSSEFLIEALKQLRENKYNGNVSIIGWDSSDTAVNTSKFLLEYEKRTIWRDKLYFKVKHVNDSLTENWEHDYDLILMNPPFVSWELLKKESRDSVKNALDLNFKGKPNEASAFFYKAVNHLSVNGVIGSVIPTSILSLDAYHLLRNNIYDIISIDLVGKLGSFIFEDALTDVSFIIAHKPKDNTVPTILWTKNVKGVAQDALRDLRKMNCSDVHLIDKTDYNIYNPGVFPIIKDSWNPISYKDNEFHKIIERFVIDEKLVRLTNVFSVKQGIRQGAKNVFKKNKESFLELPELERKYFRPVVDNDSVRDGVLKQMFWIWYPYNSLGIIFKSENELNNKVPNYYLEKLKPNKVILNNRAGISEWWGLTRPRNWQYEKIPKLVSTEFGKSDSFAFDDSGEYVVERGNAWIPRKPFQGNKDYYFYLALFSSNLFDKLLSIYSKQLAGGNWYDLGKKHTSDIPIPNVHNKEVRNSEGYRKMVMIGEELRNGNLYVKNISDEILFKFFYPNI